MKRACLAVLMCWLVPTAAFAAPCLPGTLASYVALGSTGCSVGPALFFNFVNLPLQGGAVSIADSSTFVNPLDVPYQPGFRFDVNSQAGPNQFFQRMIGYSVTNASMTGNSVSLAGSSVTPDGAVTVIENKCLGAAFGPLQSCSGANPSLVAFDFGPLDRALLLSMTFPRTTLLGVVLNVSVEGGTDGSARLQSATTQINAVPEPGTLTLLALGAMAGLRRRHLGFGSSRN